MSSQNSQQSRNERRRYATDSVISVRPQAGSAYAVQSRSRAKSDVPGGRKLWCRLVAAFAFTSLIGAFLIILGGIFVSHAYGVHSSSGFSLPLVWCVVSMVGGTIMVIGSIILGRLLISNKWKRNEQPQYGRVAPSVHYTRSRDRSDSTPSMPPSYDQSLQPAIYFISADGDTPMFTIRESPPGYMAEPPAYSTETTVIEHSTNESGLQSQEGTISVVGNEASSRTSDRSNNTHTVSENTRGQNVNDRVDN